MTRVLHARPREPSGPTTLSSLARSGSIAAPRSRLGLIVGASAIVAGSAIGSALALRMAPASAAPRERAPAEAAAAPPRAGAQTAALGAASSPGSPAATPGAAPAAGSGAPPATALPSAAAPAGTATAPGAASSAVGSPSPEARPALVAVIKDALRRFAAWSHAHPGARCPDAAALGAALDPWGQPLRIVCSDQPADQIAGVLSYGPDGEPGTRDDVVSWGLGADVTDLARGPRWSASRGMPTAAGTGGRHGSGRPGGSRTGASPAVAAPPPPRTPASTGAGSNDTDGDGIPDRR